MEPRVTNSRGNISSPFLPAFLPTQTALLRSWALAGPESICSRGASGFSKARGIKAGEQQRGQGRSRGAVTSGQGGPSRGGSQVVGVH